MLCLWFLRSWCKKHLKCPPPSSSLSTFCTIAWRRRPISVWVICPEAVLRAVGKREQWLVGEAVGSGGNCSQNLEEGIRLRLRDSAHPGTSIHSVHFSYWFPTKWMFCLRESQVKRLCTFCGLFVVSGGCLSYFVVSYWGHAVLLYRTFLHAWQAVYHSAIPWFFVHILKFELGQVTSDIQKWVINNHWELNMHDGTFKKPVGS